MPLFNTNDNQVPGGIYLCQANKEISCGACCGLYNVADPSYESIMEKLTWRTDTFLHVKRDMDAILAFKEEVEDREPQERPFPEFHHCPYIGLVGKEHSRVGCLLHLLLDENKSIDFRGLSFYGGMACRVYFCPTHYHILKNNGCIEAVKQLLDLKIRRNRKCLPDISVPTSPDTLRHFILIACV